AALITPAVVALGPGPAPRSARRLHNHTVAGSLGGGGVGGQPVTAYWTVAANKVPGVVPAGTPTTIWLFTRVHVPSLVADAVASVIGVEYVAKSVVGVPVSTYGLPAGTTAAAPELFALATGVGSTVIVKSAHGMYRPAP